MSATITRITTMTSPIFMKLLLVRRLNRRGVVNAKVIRKWSSDPHRPRVMRSCSQEQRRSVDRGTCGPGIQPRKFLPPGRRRCKEKRKAPSGGTYGTNEEVQPGTASRENATSGVWSVCDRPTAVAWRRETGDVQLSWLQCAAGTHG